MVKRKRIALIYAYNENWIGGTYYIENLIAALGQLPDAQQPELYIFSSDSADTERLQKAMNYKYWSFRHFERRLTVPQRAINKFTATLLNRRYISTNYADIDLVFPMQIKWREYFSKTKHHLYWIPDFQEHYLPAFFKEEEIKLRKIDQQAVLQLAQDIVFSSYAAQDDFNIIYPINNLKQHVLQFAVTSPLVIPQVQECLDKYGITQPYFICSNQFWKHKNHISVFRAVAKLKEIYPQVVVVFTGKGNDYRNPTFFQDLMDLRQALDLDNQTRILGFISREDQLTLMRSAKAIIQPSLFEGWSTVVEDAKSLNAPIIASDLGVHREQLKDYDAKLLFSPEDTDALVDCLARMLNEKISPQVYSYQHNITRFAQKFMSIVNNVAAD